MFNFQISALKSTSTDVLSDKIFQQSSKLKAQGCMLWLKYSLFTLCCQLNALVDICSRAQAAQLLHWRMQIQELSLVVIRYATAIVQFLDVIVTPSVMADQLQPSSRSPLIRDFEQHQMRDSQRFKDVQNDCLLGRVNNSVF